MEDGMNKYFFVVLFLAINTVIFSNESRAILGSSVEIIDNENTNVIMQNEEINMVLYKNHYEVTVTFDFYNNGPDETILLGFPVKTSFQDFPSEREWAVIDDFKTYINGNLLSERIVKEESSEDRGYIKTTKWFLREVTFPGNNHTYSKATYKAPYNSSGFRQYAGYIYGTGMNWKNAIGKMTVYINHGDDIIIDDVNIGNNNLFDFKWEANGRYKYIAENIEPENQDQMIEITIQPFDIYGEYDNDFGDFYLGWMWDECLLYKEETDIRVYTKNQVRLFINFFYAIHGYDFRNERYKNYFIKRRTIHNGRKYTINPNFSENDFNGYERRNINYLLKMERMIP
jgi:hypothetical protein